MNFILLINLTEIEENVNSLKDKCESSPRPLKQQQRGRQKATKTQKGRSSCLLLKTNESREKPPSSRRRGGHSSS